MIKLIQKLSWRIVSLLNGGRNFFLFVWNLKLFLINGGTIFLEIFSTLFERRTNKKLYRRYACAVFVVVEDRSNNERLFFLLSIVLFFAGIIYME